VDALYYQILVALAEVNTKVIRAQLRHIKFCLGSIEAAHDGNSSPDPRCGSTMRLERIVLARRTTVLDHKPSVALFRSSGRSTQETVVRESGREIPAPG